MSETLTRDNLIAGTFPIKTGKRTLMVSAGALARGSVLGKIKLGAATKAAAGEGADGANTGGGTLTLDATTPILAGAKPGVYSVKVIRAAVAGVGTTPAVPAQLAIAQLADPAGNILAVFEVLGSGGTTVANQVKFVMAESGTAFVVGDGFAITIATGSGQAKIVNSANLDGSDAPDCILMNTAADVAATQLVDVYETGEFNEDALAFGGADTHNTHRDALRALGIHLVNTQEA